MDQRNTAVRTMIQQLQDAFDETLDALYDLPEDYLQEECGHVCARGGSARDLLVHNIFHEKQHTGQVWNIRDELRLLQGWGNASLYPLLVDYYLSRAQLISALFGLTDDQLDAPPPEAAGRFGKPSSMRSAANAGPSAHSATSSNTAPALTRVMWRDLRLGCSFAEPGRALEMSGWSE